MPRVREWLDRFRPAGAPGAASPAGVPVDRRRGAAAELDPVFALLTEAVRAADRVRQEAAAAAREVVARADERARVTIATAHDEAEAVRAAEYARVREAAAAEAGDVADRAFAEAGAVLRGAAERRAATVPQVVHDPAAGSARPGRSGGEVPTGKEPFAPGRRVRSHGLLRRSPGGARNEEADHGRLSDHRGL